MSPTPALIAAARAAQSYLEPAFLALLKREGRDAVFFRAWFQLLYEARLHEPHGGWVPSARISALFSANFPAKDGRDPIKQVSEWRTPFRNAVEALRGFGPDALSLGHESKDRGPGAKQRLVFRQEPPVKVVPPAQPPTRELMIQLGAGQPIPVRLHQFLWSPAGERFKLEIVNDQRGWFEETHGWELSAYQDARDARWKDLREQKVMRYNGRLWGVCGVKGRQLTLRAVRYADVRFCEELLDGKVPPPATIGPRTWLGIDQPGQHLVAPVSPLCLAVLVVLKFHGPEPRFLFSLQNSGRRHSETWSPTSVGAIEAVYTPAMRQRKPDLKEQVWRRVGDETGLPVKDDPERLLGYAELTTNRGPANPQIFSLVESDLDEAQVEECVSNRRFDAFVKKVEPFTLADTLALLRGEARKGAKANDTLKIAVALALQHMKTAQKGVRPTLNWH